MQAGPFFYFLLLGTFARIRANENRRRDGRVVDVSSLEN